MREYDWELDEVNDQLDRLRTIAGSDTFMERLVEGWPDHVVKGHDVEAGDGMPELSEPKSKNLMESAALLMGLGITPSQDSQDVLGIIALVHGVGLSRFIDREPILASC